jgi:hypothetical protein
VAIFFWRTIVSSAGVLAFSAWHQLQDDRLSTHDNTFAAGIAPEAFIEQRDAERAG